jgi:hypothetical protein
MAKKTDKSQKKKEYAYYIRMDDEVIGREEDEEEVLRFLKDLEKNSNYDVEDIVQRMIVEKCEVIEIYYPEAEYKLKLIK